MKVYHPLIVSFVLKMTTIQFVWALALRGMINHNNMPPDDLDANKTKDLEGKAAFDHFYFVAEETRKSISQSGGACKQPWLNWQ